MNHGWWSGFLRLQQADSLDRPQAIIQENVQSNMLNSGQLFNAGTKSYENTLSKIHSTYAQHFKLIVQFSLS